MAPIALVTGATGAVGPSLVSKLISRGYIVRTLSRAEKYSDSLSPEHTHFCGSITDPEVLDAALENVDFVFHLAALLHIENPSSDLAAEYDRINVDGAQLVAKRSAQAGVKRLVYFSTVKVYGSRQSQPIGEDFPTSPKSIYARTKLQGEEVIQAVSNLDTVVLRLSPVYGPCLKGSWKRLVRAIARGRFFPIGSLKNVHSLTHVSDVAVAAILAAEHKDTIRRVFNVVGHESPAMRDILDAIYAAHHRTLPEAYFPAFLALCGAYPLEMGLRLIGKKSPLPVEALKQLIENEAYSGQSLYRLGFSPQVKITQGWTESTSNV